MKARNTGCFFTQSNKNIKNKQVLATNSGLIFDSEIKNNNIFVSSPTNIAVLTISWLLGPKLCFHIFGK